MSVVQSNCSARSVTHAVHFLSGYSVKSLIIATLVGALAMSGAAASDEAGAVKGTLFVSYNMGVGSDSDIELGARFVPDDAQISAPLNDPEAFRPVRHFNVDKPSDFVGALLDRAELTRLLNDPLRVVAVPVVVKIEEHRRVMECDAPADFATLLLVRALKSVHAVSRENAPIGC